MVDSFPCLNAFSFFRSIRKQLELLSGVCFTDKISFFMTIKLHNLFVFLKVGIGVKFS